ncbi:MAG: cellulase family glycosylhydrolase [Ruminococcus sp.]|nr:cellulase family glycosylhydrolase [Ruminococcus sp.]
MFNSKNVKRIISISAAAVCMLSSLRIAPADYLNAKAEGEMTAFEITENMKIGWNLGNTMDAKASVPSADNPKVYVDADHAGVETETSWGCPKANQTLFDALKAKGFNTVRVPTTWFQHLDENNNIDPEWMARVKEVVDYGIKNDMYIILNVHHENWINRGDFADAYDEIKPKLLKIWTQIAEEFKDYDQHLIFECMNEPRAVGSDHEWWAAEAVPECDVINKLEHDFVDLIRSTDGPYAKTRLLMLPGYCASAETQFLEAIDVPNDPYVAVSIHAYTPYDFTMNTSVKDHSVFTSAYSANLANILQGMRDTFLDRDIPVVIGEMGTSNFDNTEARVAWTTQYFTTAKKYGIPCCLWDNNTVSNPKDPGECHGYIDRTTGEWHEASLPIINKMMEIMDDESIQWASERHIPTVQHQSYAEGTTFLEGPYELDASKEKTYQNTTPGGDGEVEWSQLEGKEVAIKFTGSTPVLCFSDASYGGWTEMKPYDIDKENGIAYYNMAKVPDLWGDDPTTIAHMQAKTPKLTTVESVNILAAPEGEIKEPEATSKIKKINLKDAKNEDTLYVNLEGAPSTKTNGALGFMKGDEWTQIEWSGSTDAEGKLTVEIPLADAVVGGTVEFQIWAGFKDLDVKDYSIVSGSNPQVPGTSESTTTTAATTTTTDVTTETSTDTTTVTTLESTTTTTTDAKGNEVTLLGDANCDTIVNISDAVIIMQALSNPSKYGETGTDALHITAVGKANADCCNVGDGMTNKDALAIQKLMLKLIDKLPATDAE